MLNNIIRFSLKNRVVVMFLTAAILIWGCITLLRSDIDIFPDLNAPTVVVMTEAPGMAPEEVERLVSYPIETVVNGATNVRRVRSSSATGFSVVTIEFDWDADPYLARQIVTEKLTAIEGNLPPGVGTPTLGPQSSILGEMMIISLTADSVTDMTTLRTIADRIISPRLLALGGVSQVSVLGGDVSEYQIRLLPEAMKHYDVTLDEVRTAAQNLNLNRSGGVIYDYGNEYLVKADIHSGNVEEIGKAVVRSDQRGVVTLSDIAIVEQGPQTPRLGLASEKGEKAVLLTVTKQPKSSTITLTDQIDETLENLKKSLPADVNISTDIFRQSDFIANSISNLRDSLLEGSIFVIIVLFFFLMNFRTTLISLIALPLSIIVTVLILHWFDLTINTMSLGGMAIAIGSLVDDAIVDVENVYRRLRENRRRPDSERESTIKVVFEASKEVRLPILNSTLIIVASFLPLFFLDGIGGRLLIPLGISFITALVASTIVALTVTPVLCSYLLAGKKASAAADEREPWVTRTVSRLYSASLNRTMKHGKPIMIFTVALLALAIFGATQLGRGFLPSFNEGSLTINVSTLPGISLEESDRIGRQAENIIMSIPEIKTVARKTGRAELDEHSLGVNTSELEAPYTLAERPRRAMIAELREKLSHLPGTNIEIGQPISHRIDAMLSGTEAQIAIKVFGSDLGNLHSIATKIKKAIGNVDGVVDVNVEQQIGRPQLDIRPRRDMLARYGITNEQFANFVATMVGGEQVSQVYSDGMPFDVTLKVDPKYRDSIALISDLLIDSNEGKIPLSYVAEIVSTTGPNTINRENVNRRIVISANVDDRDLRGVVTDIQEAVNDHIKLPEGYYIQYGGQFESEAEASRTLAFASIGVLLIIFLLLMQQYHNWKQALIVLVNMPLALIGGVLILWFTDGELNIPAIIGFISLMGIATRGGMLLISRYNTLKDEGLGLDERIRRGSSDRLNAIVMTALTSALALIPLALRGGEPGNEIQSPMALVILGGLLSSTILNLFIVPILYRYITKNNEK